MPASQAYDPTNPTPYTPTQLPESAAPTPPASPLPPPQPSNAALIPGAKGSKIGAIASLGDNILRGYMNGKAQGQMKSAMQMKKKMDMASMAYNSAAQDYYELRKNGADPNSKEVQEAKSRVDVTFNYMTDLYGSQIDPGGKGKKGSGGKGKAGASAANPLEGLQSQDPHAKAEAILALLKKAGAPVYHQAAQFDTPTGVANRSIEQTGAQNEAQRTQAQAEFQKLELADPATLTDDQKKRMDQLRAFLATSPTAGGQKSYAPRFSDFVLGEHIPPGAVGLDGKPLNPQPGHAYKFENTGKGEQWFEVDPKQQLKVTAQPGTGLPEQANYQPVGGQLDVPHPVGMAPVKGEVKSVQTTDDKGNPITQLVPVIPPYKAPPKSTNNPAVPSATSTTPSPQAAQPPAPAPASGAPTPTPAGAHPAPAAAHTPPTPHQEKAAESASHDAHQAGITAHPASFPHYNKDTQGRFNAILAQELTINGKPGSKTDIGLRQATLNALDNPDSAEKIAVAMQALDEHAKSGISGHSDSDYGYIKYLKESWNTVPALQTAFGALNEDPNGKVYLDNFFRAWTNAATIRALQGTSGRPTQSMYAMLVNELPMIGVNVSDKDDAERKLNMLQDDVTTATATLPDYLRKNVENYKSHGSFEEKKEEKSATQTGVVKWGRDKDGNPVPLVEGK